MPNGLMEGINSAIQAAKAKARGYRTTSNLLITYLLADKFDFIPGPACPGCPPESARSINK